MDQVQIPSVQQNKNSCKKHAHVPGFQLIPSVWMILSELETGKSVLEIKEIGIAKMQGKRWEDSQLNKWTISPNYVRAF